MTAHNIYTLSDTTATQITPNGTHSGMDITIQNVNSVGHIYVGGEGVTSSSYGFRIMPSHAISFELNGRDDLYLVAETNGLQAAVITIKLEEGQ